MVKRIGVCLIVFLAVMLGAVSCVEEDDEERLRIANPWTWQDLARAVDDQLMDISDGGCHPVPGEHCKNRLAGTVTPGMLAELMRVVNDLTLFFGPIHTTHTDRSQVRNNLLIYFRHGFQPQTPNACSENLNADPRLDVHETCALGNVSCTATGSFSYALNYLDCQYTDGGGTTWLLNGPVSYTSSATSENEIITRATGSAFSITDVTNNRRIVLTGSASRYQVVNPVTGAPALGTTGHPNGMMLINLTVSLDLDNDPVTAEPSYPLYLANDFEDGLVLLSGRSAGVWSHNYLNLGPAAINFFTGDPAVGDWNGNDAGGCSVVIQGLDTVGRTFDIRGAATPCLADQDGVSY